MKYNECYSTTFKHKLSISCLINRTIFKNDNFFEKLINLMILKRSPLFLQTNSLVYIVTRDFTLSNATEWLIMNLYYGECELVPQII